MADQPESTAPGAVPLLAVEGSAYECGRQYAALVMRNYPGYRRYLDAAFDWRRLAPPVRSLAERRAPYLIDLYRGLLEVAGPPENSPERPTGGCTSFGLSGSITADGQPLSGQTKDTPAERERQYIVLRLRLADGPTILVLAYPGEVLGYGLWSTGLSLFRNDLNSRGSVTGQLTFVQWGLLALAGKSVQEGAELAREFGIAEAGNCLLSDATGESLAVEFDEGGVEIIPAEDGIAIHTNHPVGERTAPFEDYPDAVDREHSRYRAQRLRCLLDRQRGHITPQSILAVLADHGEHGRGTCRHFPESTTGIVTTAAVVAEPARGRLHVVRGQPCCHSATVHTF
jgi:hypothetical protein